MKDYLDKHPRIWKWAGLVVWAILTVIYQGIVAPWLGRHGIWCDYPPPE